MIAELFDVVKLHKQHHDEGKREIRIAAGKKCAYHKLYLQSAYDESLIIDWFLGYMSSILREVCIKFLWILINSEHFLKIIGINYNIIKFEAN